LQLYRRHRCDEAIGLFGRAVERGADADRAHYFIGLCHEEQGRTDLARESYRAAVRENPDYEQAIEALRSLGG
jgi:tetratricopeptide (TPR) repeat protein